MRTLILALLVTVSACTSSRPAPQIAAPTAAVPAASGKDGEVKIDSTSTEKRQFEPPPGFKVKINGWDIVYCRRTVVLGSRFPQEVCMTEAELRAYEAANDTVRRDKDQTSRICSSPAACNP